MRRLLLPFVALVVLLSGSGGLACQETAPAGEPVLEQKEDPGERPGLLEQNGPLDRFFGKVLGVVQKAPFFNVLLQSAPPFPWRAADGTVITQPVYDEWVRTYADRVGSGLDGHLPQPWYDGDGNELELGVTGQVIVPELPFVVLWLVVGALFFTLTWRFVNLRLFRHAISVVRGHFDRPDDHGEVTHFQALASALSATVGLGNIAGVAIAISLGGPGATFWLIVAGLLGMSLKFTECTLGQKYRVIDENGHVSGGPMHYLATGLAHQGLPRLGTALATLFTVFCIGGSLAGGNSFQVNQSLDILREEVAFFDTNGWVYGVGMAFCVGVVIIGGIRRIAQTAEKIVPAMCGIYIVGSLIVILANIGHVPDAFAAIVHGAFESDAVYGGVIGSLVIGFQRAAFSNEAGVGSAAIAHSAARTEYPVREGIVALLEPFIDTVVVCTMTALVIVITGVYDPNGEFASFVAGRNGAALTRSAFSTVDVLGMKTWFPYVLMVAVVLFAYSTMISWSYYGERCWTRIFGARSSLSYKVLFLVFVLLGSIVSARNVLEFGDLMILVMAFPNILGLYFLRGVVGRELREYEQKLKAGEMPFYK